MAVSAFGAGLNTAQENGATSDSSSKTESFDGFQGRSPGLFA